MLNGIDLALPNHLGRTPIHEAASHADAQILSEKQLFIRAKKLGISTFLIWEKGNSIQVISFSRGRVGPSLYFAFALVSSQELVCLSLGCCEQDAPGIRLL